MKKIHAENEKTTINYEQKKTTQNKTHTHTYTHKKKKLAK